MRSNQRPLWEPLGGKNNLVDFAIFWHPPVISQPLSFYTFSRHSCSQTWHVCIVLERWGVCEAICIILRVHDWVIASVADSLEEIVTK